MTEKYCDSCGSQRLLWPDIVGALRNMLSVMPPGMRPMVLQATEELEAARGRVALLEQDLQGVRDAVTDARRWLAVRRRGAVFALADFDMADGSSCAKGQVGGPYADRFADLLISKGKV